MVAQQQYTNTNIAGFYFTSVVDAFDEDVKGLFRCRCGTARRQAPHTGYSNLVQHVRTQHPDYATVVRETDNGRGHSMRGFDSGQETFPLLMFYDPSLMLCYSYATLSPISVDTLHTAMEAVTLAVEEK
ncbi:hypothetical protein PHMEG_0002283 [Phytophthora megakarya]|uniref:BED-type domain-containing protein n=1 Tax=Phytophthora megakarya TaxID=4795 RepID=A0A225WZT9_9STRA|nr:hypothetical protein PHMEG_0002283 [Phytophthora megakarya]